VDRGEREAVADKKADRMKLEKEGRVEKVGLNFVFFSSLNVNSSQKI
jgi:hypothetical protein